MKWQTAKFRDGSILWHAEPLTARYTKRVRLEQTVTATVSVNRALRRWEFGDQYEAGWAKEIILRGSGMRLGDCISINAIVYTIIEVTEGDMFSVVLLDRPLEAPTLLYAVEAGSCRGWFPSHDPRAEFVSRPLRTTDIKVEFQGGVVDKETTDKLVAIIRREIRKGVMNAT